MENYGNDLALLWFVALNALVLAGCWRFAARRMGRGGDRVQAALDAGLLWYGVQYLSVCVPGLVGALRPVSMTGMGGLIAVLLLIASGRRARRDAPGGERPRGGRLAMAIGLFSAAYVLAFAVDQRLLPVMSNDAMTYHFPAAVQWLQTGRLGLFQVWFFNPTNTFSPLAGSTFIAWLLAPFGNDVLARFVEAPALLLIGAGLFQICRRLGVELVTASLVSGAAVLSRALFFPSIMGKDDLFVVFFFICVLLAVTEKGENQKYAAARPGLALGLLLATKYSVLISAIPLLLAIDGPVRAKWNVRHWITMISMAGLIAGPWYLRNWIVAGNPVFPVRISLFGFSVFSGLFSMGRSEGLRNLRDAWSVLTGGNYGLPAGVFGLIVLGWLAAILGRRPRSMIAALKRDPLLRACVIGAPAGILVFLWRSPFPEVRFVLPAFILLFAVFAVAIESWVEPIAIRRMIAGGLMVAAICCEFVAALRAEAIYLATVAAGIAIVVFLIGWVLGRIGRRGFVAATGLAVPIVVAFAYVNWSAYVDAYRVSRLDSDGGWGLSYAREISLWQFCQREIPADATIAYCNTYLIYPLQGFWLDRRLVYAPVRAGVISQADLGWLGDHLSGEQLISSADAATLNNPQMNIWLEKLRRSAAGYFVVGKAEPGGLPPEARFLASDPPRFHKVFESDGGMVYKID